MAQKYGRFSWACPHCLYTVTKDTPQGLGLAKSNHLRLHSPPPHPIWVDRDYEQFPEELCGEMHGDCMNCPLPANMRRLCNIKEQI